MKNILKEYNESLQQLALYNAEEANLVGTLSIFTSSVFTELLLPSVNSKFMRIYPKTTLKVLDIPNTEVLSYFFAKYCKLCFVTTSKENLNDLIHLHEIMHGDSNAKIAYLPLLDDEIVIVARPDNPIAKWIRRRWKPLTQKTKFCKFFNKKNIFVHILLKKHKNNVFIIYFTK